MRGWCGRRLWVSNKDLILSTFTLFPLGLFSPFSSRESVLRGAAPPSQLVLGTIILMLRFVRAGGYVFCKVHELRNDPTAAKQQAAERSTGLKHTLPGQRALDRD